MSDREPADYIVIGDKRQKNREAQARWRERHIQQRRTAQRIVNILVRKTLTDEHVEQVAVLLNLLLISERPPH